MFLGNLALGLFSKSSGFKAVAPMARIKSCHDKWLGAIKSAKVLQRLTSTNEKEHLYAQNEDQKRR